MAYETGHETVGVGRIGRLLLGATLFAAAQAAVAQTADDQMAMRWWNSLNGPQMVAALHGGSATAEQETAAKKLYASLDDLTKMLVNETAAKIYDGGHHTSVGDWWETLNCQLMNVATGYGNAHDPMSPYCKHYPGAAGFPMNKLLAEGSDELAHVNKVGQALLGVDAPGMFLGKDCSEGSCAMAARWWNSLNGEQMVASLFGANASETQQAAAKKMYNDLDQATRDMVNTVVRDELYHPRGRYASVGAWWETLDCRRMNVATGYGNAANSMSPYCKHYPGSGFPMEKILSDEAKMHVHKVGMALLQRAAPGMFPTPHQRHAAAWWNSLNGPQMVKALFGDSLADEEQYRHWAMNRYDQLAWNAATNSLVPGGVGWSDNLRKLVNDAAAAIYMGGGYASVGVWWETLDCRLMNVATGYGNAADSMSPYCAHYPDSGLKELSADATMHVDKVGMALLGLTAPGRYPTTYHVPMFLADGDMHMRQSFARIINRGSRAVEVQVRAIDDAGMSHGPVTLSLAANAAQQLNSNDLELGNAMKGLPMGVGNGTGNWRLVLTSTLPLKALSYIRTADGFVTSMNRTVSYSPQGHAVVFMNPGSNTNQVSMLRLVNLGDAMANVRIEATDDAGVSPGSAVELSIPPMASRMVNSQMLEHGGDGLMGAIGDGKGKWRLQVKAYDVEVLSLMQSPTGHLTNLSAATGGSGD